MKNSNHSIHLHSLPYLIGHFRVLDNAIGSKRILHLRYKHLLHQSLAYIASVTNALLLTLVLHREDHTNGARDIDLFQTEWLQALEKLGYEFA